MPRSIGTLINQRFRKCGRIPIDCQTTGFCKLVADRATGKILGWHVVGERAIEIVQVVAIAKPRGCRKGVCFRLDRLV